MKEMDERKQEGELHLLGGSTVYKQDYAPEVLEAFTNKHQGNDYCCLLYTSDAADE